MLNIYETVTHDIIEALKAGVKPWECPWATPGFNALPKNYANGTVYTGINTVILWLKAIKYGFSSNLWLTFKQAQELKVRVKRGEKGTHCVFYKLMEVEDEKTEEAKQVPIINPFTLFNVDQIEGIQLESDTPQSAFDPNEKCEAVIKQSGADIKFGGFSAHYTPSTDKIFVPVAATFKTPEDYYATLLHELVHWTGHEKRLNRKAKLACFNDQKERYAFEELVAELGSAFLCADLGLVGELQHESYIASWLKALQEDNRYIFRAASLAAKAHKFLMQGEPAIKSIPQMPTPNISLDCSVPRGNANVNSTSYHW